MAKPHPLEHIKSTIIKAHWWLNDFIEGLKFQGVIPDAMKCHGITSVSVAPEPEVYMNIYTRLRHHRQNHSGIHHHGL